MPTRNAAHTPRAVLATAKSLVATLASPRCSLLLFTATGGGENDAQALHGVNPVYCNDTILAAVRRGRFSSGELCRDRTMFIVPSDDEAAEVRLVLEDAGHVCLLLDSASRPREVARVAAALGGEAVVRRFLVVTEKYGTSYNLPVVDVYSDVATKEYVMRPDRTVEAVVVPVTESVARQHAGRTNRGLAPGGKVVFMVGRGRPVADVPLVASEEFVHYLQLRAAGLDPLEHKKPVNGFVPFGVTSDVAADVLSIGLPPEVTIRFFASDGRLPSAWAYAMSRFCENGRSFRASRHKQPLGYNDWGTATLGGYYGLPERGRHYKVPFVPQDSDLRAKVMALSVMAHGGMALNREVPLLVDSEAENSDGPVGGSLRGPVMIPRRVVRESAPLPPPKLVAWGYGVPLDEQLGSRRSAIIGDQVDPGVLRVLRNRDADVVVDEPPEAVIRDAGESGGRRRVDVLRASVGSPIEATSPGGTVVATIRRSSWEKLVAGRPLDPQEACSLVAAFHCDVVGFSASLIFSNWSNVWLGVIRTFSRRDVMSAMMQRNLFVYVTSLMQALYARYATGVRTVVTGSVVRGNFWKRAVKGMTFAQAFRRSQERGEADIVQSEALLRRICDIRGEFAAALDEWGEIGLFAPQVVTTMQYNLGVSTPTGVGYVDEPHRQYKRRYRVLGTGYVQATDQTGDIRPLYGSDRVLREG